jgi:hypothetical protein
MALLHEIEAGPLERLRVSKVCEAAHKEGESPSLKQTLALTVSTPMATAEEIMELMQEGAAVYVVVGTRQHRLGE